MAKWISFQELRRQVSIEDVLRRYGLFEKFRKRRDEVIGLCPFHEETTSSFHASLTKNVFHCFGCQAKGNILDFVALKERVDVRNAAVMIQEWFQVAGGNQSGSLGDESEIRDRAAETQDEASEENPPLTFRLSNLNPRHPYLSERGLERETIEYFGLGYCSSGLMRGRVVIPIHNERGELVAYSGRYLGEPPEGRPKYLLPSGFRKSQVVFNLDRAGKNAKESGLVVVEGFFDVFRVWQAGFPHVVAIMGSALSERQSDLLVASVGPSGRIALLLDQDDAGRSCSTRCIDELSSRVFVKAFALPHEGDQPDLLSKDQIRQVFAVYPTLGPFL